MKAVYILTIGEKREGSSIAFVFSSMEKAKDKLEELSKSNIPFQGSREIIWSAAKTSFDIGCDRYKITRWEVT